jgi:hypothetical protein
MPQVDSAMGSNAEFERERKEWGYFFFFHSFRYPAVSLPDHQRDKKPQAPTATSSMKTSNVNTSASPDDDNHPGSLSPLSCSKSAAPTLCQDGEDSSPNPWERPYGVESRSKHSYDAHLRMGSYARRPFTRSHVKFPSQTVDQRVIW